MRVGLLFFVLLYSLLAFTQENPPSSSPSSAPSIPDVEIVPPAVSAPIPDLTTDASGALSQSQMQQLFRVVAEKDRANEKRLRDYTYIEREVQNKLDGKGESKSAEIKTYEILEIY